MYDPHDALIQRLAQHTSRKDAYSSDQDLRQVLQMTVDELTTALRSDELDLHDIAETLANAVGPVMTAIDDENEENGTIQDTADGAVVRLSKEVGYSPYYDSVLTNPEKPVQVKEIRRWADSADSFWGAHVRNE